MSALTLPELKRVREDAKKSVALQQSAVRVRVVVHMGTCGIAAGAKKVLSAFRSEVETGALPDVQIVTTGCAGLCSAEPMATVEVRGSPPVRYVQLAAEQAAEIFHEHVLGGRVVTKLVLDPEIPFFTRQTRVVLRNTGTIDPEKFEDYIARDGYAALEKALVEMTPLGVVEEITAAGLRGRGGAGFPTGTKWRACKAEMSFPKYIVGNCDEGDPGAYMDRSLLESDPHAIVEGISIAAYAIGARKGYIYVRTEYPLAIQRMRIAIEQARAHGLLGPGILGTNFGFDIEIREGSGAFVCGEETALLRSIEGAIPEPRQRPPFPVQSGLWGQPTVINNVETLANVPFIVLHGAEEFSRIGTPTSRGTKIFSLVGKINNAGLIEVPMGLALREIIYGIGGGIPHGKRFKAVQTGGPSGGCIPASLMDLPIDYESLQEAGSIMGSGGMIVMDEDTCVVDVAKFFLQFTNDESCGKCTSCRDGSAALLEVLTRISDGEGRDGDLEFLDELGQAVKDASMCGLGQSLPNPVLSTLRHFRDEYEAHIKYRRCPAVVCRQIISSPCQYLCPLGTDVPAYLALIARRQFREAMDVVRRTNPLPMICGRVCMAHCETKCRASDSGDAISVKALKRFLSDWELAQDSPPAVTPFPRKHDEKIAVIGSGPAGLAGAYWLAGEGYAVTVFEALPVAGGMLAVGIPEYRLPRKLLELEIGAIAQAGVEIRTSARITDIDALLNDGFAAVLIAAGAHKNRRLGLPGDDAQGVVDPIAFLRSVNLKEEVTQLGDRVGIIGGGNTAIDAARTALRLGAKQVTILYRRSRMEMPAAEEEVEAALEEGVTIEYLVSPTRVVTDGGRLRAVELIRTRLGDPDATGRRRPVPIEGSQFVVDLDSLMPAISQDPDLSFIPDSAGIAIAKGVVAADPDTFATTKPGVFACGDAATGPSDVTTAMATARIAAEFTHKYLRGEKAHREYAPVRPSVVVEPLELEENPASVRPDMRRLSVESRSLCFDEVELGLDEAAAVGEARRCLRCDWEPHRARLKKLEADEEATLATPTIPAKRSRKLEVLNV